ncbi:MAG: 50S ribosomal protein L22 [Chloroflexota bacterium]|nr:50S ribosomal protein L22 [Chloroflexota bacterium]MDE2858105.1 50S ribosomal protein L22 [Chloroflexota bacterium]MDE2951908.1 50S ribosomal protein L22 [Chloroflexota bacterium]
MEVRAMTKYLPISPRKLRLVCDKVRGMDAQEAQIVLDYMPQKGAALVSKTLASAMANATNNFDLNPDDLFVSQIYAGDGPTLKRFKAGARGRYKPRLKRTSHLWVILAEREEEE